MSPNTQPGSPHRDSVADRLCTAADAVDAERSAHRSLWSSGFNRRRFLQGLGIGAGVLGSQLVTTRVSFAATAGPTFVTIFLRGGMDGISALVPANDTNYLAARGGMAIPASRLTALDRGFGLHPAMAPLASLVSAGRLAAVPAIATPDLSRSHFQAQDCLERGGIASATSGWLDRTLAQMGPGTTLRTVSADSRVARSVLPTSGAVALPRTGALALAAVDVPRARTALAKLYTGMTTPLAVQTAMALDASLTTVPLASAEATPAARGYPGTSVASHLATLATLIKGNVGLRVATVDMDGWDTHSDQGTVDSGTFTEQLTDISQALAAFFKDIGSAVDNTTVLLMSEFGRRVDSNGSTGTDHGHGGTAFLLGGGVVSGVKGTWLGLAPGVLDNGDVPGSNDWRDLLGEIVTKRLGLTSSQAATVFGGWTPKPLGVLA